MLVLCKGIPRKASIWGRRAWTLAPLVNTVLKRAITRAERNSYRDGRLKADKRQENKAKITSIHWARVVCGREFTQKEKEKERRWDPRCLTADVSLVSPFGQQVRVRAHWAGPVSGFCCTCLLFPPLSSRSSTEVSISVHVGWAGWLLLQGESPAHFPLATGLLPHTQPQASVQASKLQASAALVGYHCWAKLQR